MTWVVVDQSGRLRRACAQKIFFFLQLAWDWLSESCRDLPCMWSRKNAAPCEGYPGFEHGSPSSVAPFWWSCPSRKRLDKFPHREQRESGVRAMSTSLAPAVLWICLLLKILAWYQDTGISTQGSASASPTNSSSGSFRLHPNLSWTHPSQSSEGKLISNSEWNSDPAEMKSQKMFPSRSRRLYHKLLSCTLSILMPKWSKHLQSPPRQGTEFATTLSRPGLNRRDLLWFRVRSGWISASLRACGRPPIIVWPCLTTIMRQSAPLNCGSGKSKMVSWCLRLSCMAN